MLCYFASSRAFGAKITASLNWRVWGEAPGRVELRLRRSFALPRAGVGVADVIVNPPRTRLIRDAEARSCTVLDGLGMLVHQGVIGIRHWTGVEPEPTVMRRKLEQIFGV